MEAKVQNKQKVPKQTNKKSVKPNKKCQNKQKSAKTNNKVLKQTKKCQNKPHSTNIPIPPKANHLGQVV